MTQAALNIQTAEEMAQLGKEVTKVPAPLPVFITEAKLNAMFEMQESFNVKIRKDWRDNPPNYADAIWTEAAEGFNHTKWEWWKNGGRGDTDIAQMHMEIVDVWHFLMSEVMTHKLENDVTYYAIFHSIFNAMLAHRPENYEPSQEAMRQALRNLVNSATAMPGQTRIVGIVTAFTVLVDVSGLGWQNLYKLYIGKNTLNSFRQAHGYKTDTDKYKEVWSSEVKGKEDNEYLTEILDGYDEIGPDAKDLIYAKLQEKYNELNGAKG